METPRPVRGIRFLLAVSLVIGCTALAGVAWVSRQLDAQREPSSQAGTRARAACPLQVVPRRATASDPMFVPGGTGVTAEAGASPQDVPPEIRMARLQDELSRLRESLYASNQEAARLQEQVRDLTGAMDRMLAGAGGFDALIEMKAGEELADFMRRVNLRASQIGPVRKLIAAIVRNRYQPLPADTATDASAEAYLTLPSNPGGFPTVDEGKEILALLDPQQQKAYRDWEANRLALGQITVACGQVTFSAEEFKLGGSWTIVEPGHGTILPPPEPPEQDNSGKKSDW